MMRAVCLAVALLCLVSATSASAECAWVLWKEIGSSNMKTGVRGEITEIVPGGNTTEIVSAHPTYALCKEAWRNAGDLAAFAWNSQKNENPDLYAQVVVQIIDSTYGVYVAMNRATTDRSRNTSHYAEKFRCLPDTVDPRGPKGK